MGLGDDNLLYKGFRELRNRFSCKGLDRAKYEMYLDTDVIEHIHTYKS